MTRTNPNKTATLVCQQCGGMGGYAEIVISETGQGPWYECTWCEGTGRVTPQVRSQWLHARKAVAKALAAEDAYRRATFVGDPLKMVVRRQISCDLCGNSISEASDGIGIKWGVRNYIEQVTIHESERHLCNPCLKALRHLLGTMVEDADVAAGRLPRPTT